jgi:hypothetical protein
MSAPVRQLPPGSKKKGFVLPDRSTLLLLALGFIAVNLIIAAVYLGGRGDEGQAAPIAIERVIPLPGTLIAAQEEIGADLDDTYTGVLLVDDVELPLDQLRIVDALGQVFYRPGEGKDLERLTEGNHSATVVFWPQEKTREEAARSYTWQFKVN